MKQNAQPQEPKTSNSSSSWSPILWDEYLTQVKKWRMNVSIRFYHILLYLSWIRILESYYLHHFFLSGSITSFSQDLAPRGAPAFQVPPAVGEACQGLSYASEGLAKTGWKGVERWDFCGFVVILSVFDVVKHTCTQTHLNKKET